MTPTAHGHHVELYAQVCRGCKRPFYIRQECCLPVGAYCNLCVYLSHPHFDAPQAVQA